MNEFVDAYQDNTKQYFFMSSLSRTARIKHLEMKVDVICMTRLTLN